MLWHDNCNTINMENKTDYRDWTCEKLYYMLRTAQEESSAPREVLKKHCLKLEIELARREDLGIKIVKADWVLRKELEAGYKLGIPRPKKPKTKPRERHRRHQSQEDFEANNNSRIYEADDLSAKLNNSHRKE